MNDNNKICNVRSSRLAKFIANAGVCSRRQAEEKIFYGEVQVNGFTVIDPAVKVNNEDVITVSGSIVPNGFAGSLPRLWLFHKPRNVIVSRFDPQGRAVIFDLLPQWMPRVISIGRLDRDTEGLILFTDRGYIARFFELPVNRVPRTYLCEYFGEMRDEHISAAAQGKLNIGGVRYGEVFISRLTKTRARITLHEGKNREIRKIMDYFGLKVVRLFRESYGSFSAKMVKEPGDIIEVSSIDLLAAIQHINLS